MLIVCEYNVILTSMHLHWELNKTIHIRNNTHTGNVKCDKIIQRPWTRMSLEPHRVVVIYLYLLFKMLNDWIRNLLSLFVASWKVKSKQMLCIVIRNPWWNTDKLKNVRNDFHDMKFSWFSGNSFFFIKISCHN